MMKGDQNFSQKSKESLAIVYIWPNVHASIKICHNGDSIYISLTAKIDESGGGVLRVFKNVKKLYSHRAFLNSESELRKDPNYKAYYLRGLNTELMYKHASKIEEKINNENFQPDDDDGRGEIMQIDEEVAENELYGLAPNALGVCSEVVFELLELGGIRALLPYYADIFNPCQLFFLTLRPSFAVAAFVRFYQN